jgi:UMF1 family MFS transporter
MPTLRRASAHKESIEDRSAHAVSSRLSIGSWVLYDVSNTIFFAGVTGIFFPLWVVNDMGGSDATIGFTVAGAMLANLLVAPVFGAMSDNARRRLPFLAVFSLIGIASTFLLGTLSLEVSIVLFGVALVAMHTGIVIYNALLVEVSTARNRGFIGGLGIGVGYLGALLAVLIGLTLAEEQGYVMAFRTIGVLMLVMTLPVLTLLRERPRELRGDGGDSSGHGAVAGTGDALRRARQYPGLISFLIGRFWYYLAVNTASIFAFLYGTKTIGFSETKVYMVLGIGILTAIAAASVWGRLSDRIGPFRSMKFVLCSWVVVLLFTVAIPWLNLPADLYWIIGPASGVLVAGTWVVDRPLLLRLIPEEHAGQFFGLHSLTGRLGTIVGPAAWGFIADDVLWFGLGVGLGFGPTASVTSLIAATAFGLYFVTRSGEEVRAATRPQTLTDTRAGSD